ncbi:MAG: sporulation protein YtfJ [Clostridia bacterium]|nr:sporulation protein YtfJ [Clostridia bacterium]MBQ3869188.1 sporulation protein YtfJ [Clostridia bacterium]
MAEDRKFNDALKTAFDNLKEITGTDTIIGEPLQTPNGTVIIPVTRVSVGFATGGSDYIGKHSKETDVANSFSGAGGGGISVTPVAFLVISPEGDAKILNVNNPADSNADLGTSIVSLLNKTPVIVDKVKAIFKKDKKKETEEPEPEEIDLSEIIETKEEDKTEE